MALPSAPNPSDGVLKDLGLDAGTLFFVDLGPDGSACQIRSMPVAGGDSTLLYEGRSKGGDCEALRFSAQGGHLFWMDTSAAPLSSTLRTMPTTGGTATPLLTDIVLWAGNFVSDEENVYFGAELADGRSGVLGVPIAGGDANVLYRDEAEQGRVRWGAHLLHRRPGGGAGGGGFGAEVGATHDLSCHACFRA
jgi:hypothetical protein